MIQYLRYLVNSDHQITLIVSPPDGKFVNYTAMTWWYWPLNLVFRDVEHILNRYNIFNHLVMAWNDPIFEIPGK